MYKTFLTHTNMQFVHTLMTQSCCDSAFSLM